MDKEAYEIQREKCVSSKADVSTGNLYKMSYICNIKMESILKCKEKKLNFKALLHMNKNITVK